jgi:hypothetical protein
MDLIIYREVPDYLIRVAFSRACLPSKTPNTQDDWAAQNPKGFLLTYNNRLGWPAQK